MAEPLLLPGLGPTRTVAFGGGRPDDFVAGIQAEIRELYRADGVPWVLGYSGGKDSTLTTQLVWGAVAGLPPEQRTKTIHVITTDTGVENPVISAWVSRSLTHMREAAAAQGLPFEVHQLRPKVEDAFWTCLIGRGYAAPRPKFRWCTERLKIRPSNKFIRDVVAAHGEVILVLGIRKKESTSRALSMARHERGRVRERLSPNGSLPNSLVYSPIEALDTDEVWTLLMQYPNPWNQTNKDLLAIYQGASADSECPLVVDTSTPTCGDSRFGCWTCTMVSADKSMQAMISNDEEKEWMLPLLRLRDALDIADDRHLRDFRRSNGSLLLFNDRLVHGPYTQQAREDWLRRLLHAQTWIRAHGPDHVRDIELVSQEELCEIRRIWVLDKHEVEDSLPGIYLAETGESYPGPPLDSFLAFDADSMEVLREVCGDDEEMFLGVRALLGVERKFRTHSRRAGLFPALEKVARQFSYADEEEALAVARRRAELGRTTEPDEDQLALFDPDAPAWPPPSRPAASQPPQDQR